MSSNSKRNSWHQPDQIGTQSNQEQLRPEHVTNADMPTMHHQNTDHAKEWNHWALKIKERAIELEKKGDIQAALQFNLTAQALMANNFPSFADNSPGAGSSAAPPRLPPSPIAQQQQQQQQMNNNGNGAGMNGMPMAAGQQADVNFLFQKLVELSEVLKDNREKTAGVIAGAEELAVSLFTLAFQGAVHLPPYCCIYAVLIANVLP